MPDALFCSLVCRHIFDNIGVMQNFSTGYYAQEEDLCTSPPLFLGIAAFDDLHLGQASMGKLFHLKVPPQTTSRSIAKGLRGNSFIGSVLFLA